MLLPLWVSRHASPVYYSDSRHGTQHCIADACEARAGVHGRSQKPTEAKYSTVACHTNDRILQPSMARPFTLRWSLVALAAACWQAGCSARGPRVLFLPCSIHDTAVAVSPFGSHDGSSFTSYILYMGWAWGTVYTGSLIHRRTYAFLSGRHTSPRPERRRPWHGPCPSVSLSLVALY